MSTTDTDTDTESYLCTFCGDTLASGADAGPGDELHCEACGVSYELVAESDRHDLAVFLCPYCGEENKRAQSVESVICENDARVNGDCGLEFDPAGAQTRSVSESDEDERPKMIPTNVEGY